MYYITQTHRVHTHAQTCQNSVKGLLHVGRVQGGCLDKGKPPLLRVGLCIVLGDGPQVPEVALIAHEHDDDVVICMVSKLLEPSVNILKSHILRNVVHEKRPHSTPVIPVIAGGEESDEGWQVYRCFKSAMRFRCMEGATLPCVPSLSLFPCLFPLPSNKAIDNSGMGD
jgi:hypothetical protein